MIELIKNILGSYNELSGYDIVQTITKSKELFLIKKSIDMDRAKEVEYFKVVVYKDITEGCKLFKGVASCMIHPTMSKEEVIEEINEAVLAAEYAKNEYYPLVKGGQTYIQIEKSSFDEVNFNTSINKIAKALYKKDNYENGCINSSEIFLDKVCTRVINSEGVDISYENYSAMIEYITTWKGENEEIELYSCLKFSDYQEGCIEDDVEFMLNIAKERAKAIPTPSIKDIPVIITGKAVQDLMRYYCFKSNASTVYNKQSNFEIGEMVFDNNKNTNKGDLLTLKLDPFMKNSTYSAPCTSDGIPQREAVIIENGVLKNYIASNKFAHYLQVEPTGDTPNIIVKGGTKTINELKESPYLEILAFSDFTMDGFTGNFGGEIRLAMYFDGTNVTPLTGGAISANISNVQNEMYFSKEIIQLNNFIGPKAIKLIGVSITGK